MTDYLEQAVQGGVDALWQASRERGVPISAERKNEDAPAGEMPLLEELVRAQRQSESAVFLTRNRGAGEQTAAFPDKRLRHALGEDVLSERERGGAVLRGRIADGEDHLWARRVDLAFQRDSRRYDGAFSLY